MIKNVVFLLILLLFSCCSLKTERKVSEEITMARNDVDIKMVVLHHVNLIGIFTIVDVSCEEFERVFCDSMKKDTIVEPNEISLLETYIDNLKRIDSLSINSMDTRCKLYLISPSDTTEYCVDSGVVYSDGVYYEISNELYDYIEKLGK